MMRLKRLELTGFKVIFEIMLSNLKEFEKV